jgi:hypothetical protein
MRLVSVSQLFEKIRIRVIVYIKINKVNPVKVFYFEPMHDGRHALAGTSPEGEDFNKLELS